MSKSQIYALLSRVRARLSLDRWLDSLFGDVEIGY
jgi:hypothetical protein